MELYEERREKSGKAKANIRFGIDVLLLFRPGIIGFNSQHKTAHSFMIKNYLLVTWRNALSHKGYTAINVIGLSLGIAVTVLLLLFVVHEMSYDTFHYNKDRIFRVKAEIKFGEQTSYATAMSASFGSLAKE